MNRAQLGTTKYCSKYLRNEQCTNPNCMFLHETAEDSDSYTRQELSSLNAGSTQRPSQSSSSAAEPPQPQPLPQQVTHVATATAQGMARQGSRDEAMSRSDSGDGSALPSTASWAAKNPHFESRRSSKPASISASSPVIMNASTAKSVQADIKASSQPQPQTQSRPQNETLPNPSPSMNMSKDSRAPAKPPPMQDLPLSEIDLRRPKSLLEDHPFNKLMQSASELQGFAFNRNGFSPDFLREIDSVPPLFDANAGLRMFRVQKRQEEERRQEEENRQDSSRPLSPNNDDEEHRTGGSLQLGGEPEVQNDRAARTASTTTNARSAIQPPFSFDSMKDSSLSSFPSQNTIQGRFQFPQQSQSMRPTNTTSLHQHQQSNPFSNSNLNTASGHSRQFSRYNFANDPTSHSTTVNLTSNANLYAQPGSAIGFMPSKQPQSQTSSQGQHLFSNVQGPPPGLKSSGTPPVSGGGMFGQGHGFASAMGGSLGLGQMGGNGKNTNDELMRGILNGRGSVSSPSNNFGKREFTFPSQPQPSHTLFANAAPTPSLQSSSQGIHLGPVSHFQDQALQKQKKKGRKHRHANTSSSGGGGLVDLADPSILQARMHHGGVGQGQFGVGQGGYNQSSMLYGNSYSSRW